MPGSSDAILARLHALHPKSIDLSLGRIERLLARLGHPERHLPPVVHIAGTNGKGSTLAFLAAMLKADGRLVHRYISPHLVSFNERILIDGEPIEEPLLAALLDECEQVNAGEPVTFFEITTAAAFLAFSRIDADAVLLETGLGGRLDATNVVSEPRLTIITPISMDHESYLGTTVEQIAAEKAGILKPGVPAIIGPQTTAALRVIEGRAAALSVPLIVHGRDWTTEPSGTGFTVHYRGSALALPYPALVGRHQIDNAATAVIAALALDELTPSIHSIHEGMTTASWLARLQPLMTGALIRRLPAGSSLRLDGGHNPAAGVAVGALLDAERGRDARPLHLVVGMLATKDAAGFLAPLVAHATSVQAIAVPDEAMSQDPEMLVEATRRLGGAASSAASLLAALDRLADGPPVRVLICGSLYLAGHVLRLDATAS